MKLKVVALAMLMVMVGVGIPLKAGQEPGAGSKPIKEQKRMVNYGPGSPESAAAIITAQLIGPAKAVNRSREPDYDLWTEYTFQIIDIVKVHPRLPYPGETITLRLMGGEMETPSYILRQAFPDSELPIPGHVYLIYLGWNKYYNELVAQGHSGTFDITDGQLTSLSTRYRDQNGLPAKAFIEKLRVQANGK